MKKSQGAIKHVAKNKKAQHDYQILERFEAGIVLVGTEAKSLRAGQVSLTDAYCKVEDGELNIIHLNIAAYDNSGYIKHNPTRKRKLLMHYREILKLHNKLVLRGYTLIPLGIYFKRGWAKVELGLAKGRPKADKREYLKQKEAKREIRKYMG